MSTGEDEPSSSLNGRLRPRKSTTINTTTPSPQNKTTCKTEEKFAQDRLKKTIRPSKALPTKQNDLVSKSDISSVPLFLCPYCDRKFNAKQTASKHAKRIHISSSKQDNFIKCLYCNHSDAESNAVIKHMVDSHPNQYFACLDCHTRFPSTTELAEHKFNVCEKQKLPYCSKSRKKTSARTKKNTNKKFDTVSNSSNENPQYIDDDGGFSGIVISCELKPSEMHDAADIEDKITTNLILPPSKTRGNIGREKNAVIVLDDLQWSKRIPPNFSFHNTDADQILSRLGVVHRSPRVGESRKDLIKLMDEPNEKFEKCFDTSFYTKVAKNVKDNLTKYLDGSFNFNSNRETATKTRKSKCSVVINTAEGFPILLSHEQFSRNLFDRFLPRAMAPKHKWKWDTAGNYKNIVMLPDQTKRDSHVNNCIVTLISSLDIWTQLRMKSKFEEIFKTTRTINKTEKQNIISLELKEILESRDIPTTSSQVVQYRGKSPEIKEESELPAYLGLSPMTKKCMLQPAVLSGEWVRPRCFVCCACGEQTRDSRTLSTHLSSQHPNAQVQHYEIVGETLLSADIVKHLYVPPSQISNRTRPPRGFRDCTKCKKSITQEDLHQHMLDCAGDTPTVRRKCRYRPFGVRRRRPRLPDNIIRKKMRKDIRSRHRQNAHMRPRPRVRTEVGDAETIRKMIADLPAKRNRITPSNVLRPRRNIIKVKSKKPVKLRASGDKQPKKNSTLKTIKNLNKSKRINENDTDSDSSTVDEDDQPLKLSASTKTANNKDMQYRTTKSMEHRQSNRENPNIWEFPPNYYHYNLPYAQFHPNFPIPDLYRSDILPNNLTPNEILPGNIIRPVLVRPNMYPPYQSYFYPNQFALQQDKRIIIEQAQHRRLSLEQAQRNYLSLEEAQSHGLSSEQVQQPGRISPQQTRHDRISSEQAQYDHSTLERVEHDRLLHYIQAQHSHLSLEQARHYCLALEKAGHNHLALERAQYDQREMEKKQCNQVMPEKTRDNQHKKEQAQHNQLVIEQSCQRIDVHYAGSSNIRQHSNSNNNNIDGGKDHPVGRKEECNQSNNVAQVPHMPLKHSIASLTSRAESRDLATPYYHPYLFPSKTGKIKMYESSNNRKDFEKESSPEKLYKPPLPNDPIDLKQPDQRPFSPTNKPGGRLSSPDESVKSQKPDPKHILPNDSLKRQESDKQSLLPYDTMRSADHDGKSPLLDVLKKSEKPCKQLLLPNDLIDPQGTGTQQPLPNDEIDPLKADGQSPLPNPSKETTQLNKYQLKIEASRTKFLKKRRNLSDCVEILMTKKCVDLATSEYRDSDTQDSEIIDPETLYTETFSVSVASDPIESKSAKENNGTNIINLTSQVFSRSALPEQYQGGSFSVTKTHCDSTDDQNLTIQTDNTYLRQGETSTDSVYGTSNTKQHDVKSELSRTRSLSCTESEIANTIMQTDHSLFVKPKQAGDVNRDIGLTMRRNSVGEFQTVENLLYNQRGMETAKTSDFKLPNLAQNRRDDRVKIIEGKEDIDQQFFQVSNQQVVIELQKQCNISESTLTIGRVVNQETQVAQDTKNINNTEIPIQQTNVSPASRRTRRKPTKKTSISEQQIAFYHERSTQNPPADKSTRKSPLHHSSYRSISKSLKESNAHEVSVSNLPPATSIEAFPLRTPPDSQRLTAQRKSNKRVLNSSETDAGIIHNHDNGSQNKMFKKSLETHAENVVDMQNLRRHSIELAQHKHVNYDILMAQKYRERCEKAFLNTSPPSRGLSYSRKATQDDFIQRPLDGNVPYDDRSSERHPQYSSVSTYVSTTHGTYENMNVNPESISNDMTRETQDHKMDFKDEHFRKKLQRMSVRQQRCNNSESIMDYSMKEGKSENEFTAQERKATLQTSNLLDSPSQRLGIRRSSVDYYTRSSPYQCNVQNIDVLNISDQSLDMVSDEKTNTHSININSLRAYHESVAGLLPTVPYSNNMYNAIPPIQFEHNAEDVTPLDLSCDIKVRRKAILDSCKKSPDVLKNPCGSRISNENHCDEPSLNVNNRYKYPEQQNLPQHPLLHCYKPPNKELAHKSVSLGNNEKTSQEFAITSRNDMLNHRNKLQTTLNTEIAQSANLDNSSYELNQKTYGEETSNIVSAANASNSSSDKSSYLPPECNYLLPPQISNPTPIVNRQESMQEKTFLENKKIARSSTQGNKETQYENDKSVTKNNTALTKSASLADGMASDVENINQYETFSNVGHRTNSLTESIRTNEMSSNDNQMQETTFDDKTAQIYNQDVLSQNDHIPIDQDAETARKFAMLPEELVKILGTIPKDHRNQLLNVLPQYVSNPVSTAKTEMTNLAATASNTYNVKSQVENKTHTTSCGDSSRLSVNTAISPSSILPKKRHSPSQSRGSLNHNELQPIPPVLHTSPMPTLFRPSSIRRDDKSENNSNCSQNSCVQKKDSDSLALHPFTEVVTRKSFEKDDDYTEINFADLKDPENMNKNKDLSKSAADAFFPPSLFQDLTCKHLAKNKHCNEQTASLRAVRIKTTSARKPLSDEKSLLTNYSFKTNISIDEEYTNPGQMIGPQHHHNYINLADFNYTKVKMSPLIQNEHNADMLLQASTAKNASINNQDESKSMTSSITYNNLPREKDEGFICNLPNCATISQSDDKISYGTSQSINQLKKAVTLEPSATVALQNTNMVVGHFLEQMKSTTSPDGGKHNNLMSVQPTNAFSSCNEVFLNRMSESQPIDGHKNHFTSEWKPPLEVTKNTNEVTKSVNQFFPPSKINEENQALSSASTNDKISQQNFNKACQDKTFEKSLAFSSECAPDANISSEILSLENEKSNEDDSEDDVSLAVIKQKRCCHLSASETDLNTPEVTSEQIKLDTQEKKYQLKVDLKHLNRTISNSIDTIHKDNLTGDDNSINDVLGFPDVQLNFNEEEAKLNGSIKVKTVFVNNTVEESNKNNNKINECEVNKEKNITENKIKEDDLILSPERNPTECQLENFFGTPINNEYNDASNVEMSIDHQSDEESVAAAEEIQRETDEIISCNFEISETDSFVKQNQLKPKTNDTLNFNNKSEIEYSVDVEDNNESNLFKSNSINAPSINESNLTSDNLELSESLEVSIKDSTKPRDGIVSDVCEINTLPLRRSRRGKSLYVDSSSLEDNEQIVHVEVATKKTPLTMKRLILSRVERDRKRISESNIFEKNSEAINDLQFTDCNDTNLQCMKKEKTKRTKSPHYKRKSKKVKKSSAHQHEEISNIDVKNKMSMLQELPNVENEIDDKDISKEEESYCVNLSNITSSSEISTIIENEKVCVVADDNFIDIEDSNVPGKRKLSTTKITNWVSSKPKKSKHHKKKPQSDFDSDDEKVLLETKQKIVAEKHLIVDIDSSTISICEKTVDEEDSEIMLFDKEDSERKLLKTSEELSHDISKQTTNVSMARMTCYNRPMSNKKLRAPSASQDHANYDPYDIDFEDMIDTSEPMTKKKGKNVCNIHASKFHHDKKINMKSKELSSTSKQNTDELVSNVNNESDSDSSKSDVPLQKYVKGKTSEADATNANNKDSINAFDNNKYENGQVKESPQTSDITQETLDNSVNTTNDEEKTNSANFNEYVFRATRKRKKSSKRIKKGVSLCKSETLGKDYDLNTNNYVTVNKISQKRQNKKKKIRRMRAATNVNSVNVSDEADQQLRSDKFMENFGFYSEKVPRKSNLLAAKKIAETFHMIGNESEDSFLGCTEKASKKSTQFETKKKFEACSTVLQDSKISDEADCQSTESRMDIGKALIANEPCDVTKIDDNDLDLVTAQNIMESEEVRNLENDLFSGFKEAAKANAARNRYIDNQCTPDVETNAQDVDKNVSILHLEQGFDKSNTNLECIKKSKKKNKPNIQAGVKDKMYPDIEEIDMFEDKFDKIKRKSRSQAVAAKQVQHVVEINTTSAKSRKQVEKKRSTKSTKKNNQSTQVLTKGALKEFEGIKISIPTQDLNMPSNVSPPRQQKKRKKDKFKRRKGVSDSESSCNEFDNREKTALEKDIYEFKESEDTELFELRPSTVMDRFRSMHNKRKFKNKEKDKVNRDSEKDKQRAREKEKKAQAKEKELVNVEKEKNKDRKKCPDDEKKSISREGGRCKEIQKELNDDGKDGKYNKNIDSKSTLKTALDDTCMKKEKCHHDDDNNKKVGDTAIAGTSGFVPDRVDESDSESEISSPEGEFIFYTSEDVNCVCASDNDSDESDIEKRCGRLNCIYKNRDADKNAAIGNIFKNNAVRCDKTQTKEPEKPRPDLDQLFDSLFETNPIVNSEILDSRNEAVSEQTEQALSVSRAVDDEVRNRTSTATVSHHDLIQSEPRDHLVTSSKEICPIFNESFSTTTLDDPLWTKDKSESKKVKIIKNVVSKNDTLSSSINEIMSDSDSIQIFTIDDKPKESLGYSLVSEECTQVNFADIIADEMATKNEKIINNSTKTQEMTVKTSDQLAKYNSEDEFDIDKPESLNRQYMHLVLPADKASSCAQTEHKSDNSDAESGNESAVTKYLKGLSPSEAAKIEIYTMVSAQSTQTSQPNTPDEDDSSKHDDFSRTKTEDGLYMKVIPRSRIRLQKYDIHEISKKSISSKYIQTDNSTSCKSLQCDTQTENGDENETGKLLTSNKNDSAKETTKNNKNSSNSVFDEEINFPSPKDGDSFATPASKPTANKHSPKKSDEGISTSHDYSADAFDQASFDDTGVARQRARRKCTVGKQNVLAEHWSSESEFEGVPPRPNSADSVVASAGRRKKIKKGHHSGGRRGSRHASKNESKNSSRRRAASGGRSDDSDAYAGPSRAPPGPKIRARPAPHYWSSDGEETSGPQQQHGWIVGDSHKKLVTMLAHAKGRKRNSGEKQHLLD